MKATQFTSASLIEREIALLVRQNADNVENLARLAMGTINWIKLSKKNENHPRKLIHLEKQRQKLLQTSFQI